MDDYHDGDTALEEPRPGSSQMVSVAPAPVGDMLLGAGDASTQMRNTAQGAESQSTANLNTDSNLDPPFFKLLHKELVVDKLVSLLNFEDMKALSEVSSECLYAVRKTKSYFDRAQLIVCKEVVNLCFLKDSTYAWKHISLDLSLPMEVVELIEDILEGAESLVLRLPCAKEDKEVVEYIGKIFQAAKQLTYLDLDVALMSKVLHDVFSDVTVQARISNLKGLSIHGYVNKPGASCYIDGSEDDSETPFQRNFLQLSMVPLHLKKFVFGKVIPIMGTETHHVKFIPNIVEATKETLEELALHLKVWKFDEMKGIRCPRLKRLTISAYGDDDSAKIVQTFLKNQPPLEELTIEMKNEFPIMILLTIQGMLSKMKKLHLKAKRFVGTPDCVDWKFLGSMSELKDFSLRKPFGNTEDGYEYGEELLRKLPPTIEKISLQGITSFWQSCQPVDRNIGVLLERFPNLKELNLLRSREAINDEGLQSIIAGCSKLVALAFSHCPDVTNAGVTGVFENWVDGRTTGKSLNDLQGLTRLKIRSCPNIEPDSLLGVVKFPYLRSFDYYKNIELPKDFLFEIVKQNSCLEDVALHIRTYDNDADHMASIRTDVKKINPRVHRIEILEQSNWEDEDSDSDASSIPDDGQSSISGGPREHFDDYFDYDDDYDDSPSYFDDQDDYDVDDDEYDFNF